MGKNCFFTIALVIVSTLGIKAQHGTAAFEFVQNKGQWEDRIAYKGELSSGAFFLEKNGFTVLLHHPADLREAYGHVHERKNVGRPKGVPGTIPTGERNVRSHAYNVRFRGAAEQIDIVAEKPLSSYNNYFIGNDPNRWASEVGIYQAVLYRNVYPNIDVRYYSENGLLKYDIIVKPGGRVGDIAMQYEGASKLSVKNKELVIKTSVGEVKELYPYTFQFDQVKGRQEVDCSYEVTGNTVRFRVGEYSKDATLIIDPSLIFSSFTGSSANQYGFTATPGPDGSFYSGGIVFAAGFPTTTGAFQSNFAGGGSQPTDIGIMKFSPNGSQRMYATYIGGGNNEYPHSLFCDPDGNLVVMGRTYSNNLSGNRNYPGTRIGPGGGSDIVVTKLNATGTALIGSLIIGGPSNDGVNIEDMQMSGNTGLSPQSLLQNYGDDSRSEVILDRANNIYVAAQTRGNFPVTAGVFQPDFAGGQDGIVLKISPDCNSLLWASYLGGSQDDGAFVLALNPVNNDLYVSGATSSTNFPGDKAGTIGPAFTGGMSDGFVSIISNDGTTLRRSTFLGSTNQQLDIIYGIQFDRIGFPYVMGITRGNWPTVNNPYSNPGSKQFVAKLQPNLSAYVYSTVFGSGANRPNMSPVAFLVDRCENVYISGWGGWLYTQTGGQATDPFQMAGVAGMPITNDAIKSTTDNRDFYFIVLEKDVTNLLYGTFFGQTGGNTGEHVDGGTSRFDQQGAIYQAMCANCAGGASFPTTPGVVGPINGALQEGCNLAAVKIAFNFAGVAAGPKAFANGIPDSTGCVPFTVNLRDTVRNARSYEWQFGDGTPDVITSDRELQHTFNTIGNFRVRLIAIDSTTCNIRDTSYITIRVSDDIAALAFNAVKLPPCESLSYQFENLSTAPANKPYGALSFTWDFGDGTRVQAGPGNITHSYANAGTYNVRLILTDTGYCNSPDSIQQTLRVAPLVDARFQTPSTGCAPYEAIFENVSLAGAQFYWDFGDGTTSTEVSPSHLYSTPGTYQVRLIAVDSSTCNISDTTTATLIVAGKPSAAFSHSPVPAEENRPTVFNNLSNGGVRYKWLFGDGDSTIRTTMDTVMHQYNSTGVYEACLIVYNSAGCTDTVCMPVQAVIIPLLDVPNAFTPGRFGRNSIVRVEGFGIARMNWKIYNRWGQKVFESASRTLGWDGTFNGTPQPMDVYAYTLEVEFSDGTKTRKTGDITLIR